MKASELIKKLQVFVDEGLDLDIVICLPCDDHLWNEHEHEQEDHIRVDLADYREDNREVIVIGNGQKPSVRTEYRLPQNVPAQIQSLLRRISDAMESSYDRMEHIVSGAMDDYSEFRTQQKENNRRIDEILSLVHHSRKILAPTKHPARRAVIVVNHDNPPKGDSKFELMVYDALREYEINRTSGEKPEVPFVTKNGCHVKVDFVPMRSGRQVMT